MRLLQLCRRCLCPLPALLSNADGSYSVRVYSYGLLQSETRYDSNGQQIGGTTYGYDQYFRPTTNSDYRNGATVSYYNNMDLVNGTVSPSPGGGQSAEVTTNFFDSMGRMTRSVLPDGSSTTNAYYPTGVSVTPSASM